MAGIEISRALHLLGVIFWVGGMGARLLLLGSVRSGPDEMMRAAGLSATLVVLALAMVFAALTKF